MLWTWKKYMCFFYVDCHVDFWCSNLVQTMKATSFWSWKSTTTRSTTSFLISAGARKKMPKRRTKSVHFWPWTPDDTGISGISEMAKKQDLHPPEVFFGNFRHPQCLFVYMFLGAAVRITPNGGWMVAVARYIGSHGRSGATTGAWAMKLFPGCWSEVRNVPALFYESCPYYDILKTKQTYYIILYNIQ